MNKSRVESAVQELPARSARSRTEVSSMRSLDNLVLPADRVDGESTDEDIDVALSILDPDEDLASTEETEGDAIEADVLAASEESASTLEFDPQEPDDEIHIEDLDPEETPVAATQAVAELLRDLEGPLSVALAEAERVLGDPERVATWVENQARRRLLSLAERFADELKGTEMKRALTSPPPAD